MLLADPNFVSEEIESPFLLNNKGFLEKQNVDQLVQRTHKWLQFLAISEDDDTDKFSQFRDKEKEEKEQRKREKEGPSDEAIRRIVVLDAERTFKTDRRRKELSDFLYEVATSFGNYHQALSYVSAFLLLTFSKPVVFKILSKLNSDKKYVVKYWQETAVGMATDAYVLQELTQFLLPEVSSHLSKNTIFPETYCPKWFCGLCTQILPIEDLFDFFEKFLQSGCVFLFQFGLSVFQQTKLDLLKANDPTTLFTILRLDSSWVETHANKSLIKDTISNTNQFDLSKYDFEEMRPRLFKLHLQERLERSAKQQAEKNKALEDDDDDELFGSEDDDENQGECQSCENLLADVYCSDCKLILCDVCHKKNKKGHSKAHSVTNIEDLSEELKKTLKLD